jgi:hypothetical protein
VASGLWPDVEGGRLAARKKADKFSSFKKNLKVFRRLCGLFRRAGRRALRQARTPAATWPADATAANNQNTHEIYDMRFMICALHKIFLGA